MVTSPTNINANSIGFNGLPVDIHIGLQVCSCEAEISTLCQTRLLHSLCNCTWIMLCSLLWKCKWIFHFIKVSHLFTLALLKVFLSNELCWCLMTLSLHVCAVCLTSRVLTVVFLHCSMVLRRLLLPDCNPCLQRALIKHSCWLQKNMSMKKSECIIKIVTCVSTTLM